MRGFQVPGVVGSASCEGDYVVDRVSTRFSADVAHGGCGEDPLVAFADGSGVGAALRRAGHEGWNASPVVPSLIRATLPIRVAALR